MMIVRTFRRMQAPVGVATCIIAGTGFCVLLQAQQTDSKGNP